MPLTLQVLLALVAGLGLGLGLSGSDSAFAQGTLSTLGPVGTLWINAIRMTVIPLVTATLIVGVGSAPDARAVGLLGARSLLLFVIVLAAASAVGVVMGSWLLGAFSFDAAAVDAMRASASSEIAGNASVPTLGEWLIGLVPIDRKSVV